MNKKRGFTLIEILLAVAVITFLSSIIMFNSTEAKNKAEDAHMASESHQIENAIVMFKDKNNSVPHDISVTSGKVYKEEDPEYEKSLKPLVEQNFISEIPHSPDGKSYAYGFSDDYQESIFVANLKTKKSTSSSSNDSCSFIEPAKPTNCFATQNTPNEFSSCTLYLQDNADKMCFLSKNQFCIDWNTEGDFPSICPICPPGRRCPEYETFCSCIQGVTCYCDFAQVICDAPAPAVCNGDNPNEVCSCVN